MKSLSRQILQSLLLTVLGLLGAWALAEYGVASQQGRQELLAAQKASAERLAFNLDHPLWNLDRADVERTVLYEAADKAVTALLVNDEHGVLYVGKLRVGGALVDLDPHNKAQMALLGQAYSQIAVPILMQGRNIGTLRLYVSDLPLRSRLRRQWLAWLLKVTLLLLALLATAYLMLRRSVVQPLEALMHWVGAVAPGRPLPPAPPGLGKELQALLEAFEGLAARITKDSEALRSSEEWHRVLFERSPYALMTLRPPDWRFNSGNAAAVKIFGAKDEAEFLSKAPWECSPPTQPDGRPSAEKAQEMIATALGLGSHYFEWQHRRLGGELFPATVMLSRVEINGQLLLQATVRDESERQELLASAARGTQNYETLYLFLPQPVFVYDLGTQRFVDANPAAGQLLKLPPEEIRGLSLAQFVPPDLREAFIAQLKARDPKAPAHDQQRIQDSQGRLLDVEVHARYFEMNGRPLRLVMMEDITSELAAQAALAANEARFRALLENTSDIVMIYRADGSVSYENPASATAVLGYSAQELASFGTFELVHPDDLASTLRRAEKSPRPDRQRTQLELRLRTKDGSYKTFDARSINLGSNPVVGGVLVQLRDVSASREGQRHLLRLERLAAIGQTAAGLAHEVRNPLAIIQARAELLKSQLEASSAMQADLDSVLRQVDRLKDLVNQVLESSRVEDLALKEVAADELLEAALRAARMRYGMAAEGIQVDRALDDPAPHVQVDPVQMERVLLNLILNAYQAMGTKGALALEARREDAWALLSVSDNGPGIPEAKAAKAFEPFYTTKHTGSGLGLWICRNIVEQHGGKLELESLKPQGCRFTVRLPLAIAREAE